MFVLNYITRHTNVSYKNKLSSTYDLKTMNNLNIQKLNVKHIILNISKKEKCVYIVNYKKRVHQRFIKANFLLIKI